MGEMERSLGQVCVKEGDSKSAISQLQLMTGHKVVSKPVTEGVSVIDSDHGNLHRRDLHDLPLPLLKDENTRGSRRDRQATHLLLTPLAIWLYSLRKPSWELVKYRR